ncbi:MAG: hypothetical protein ACRBBW_09900 [Cellvibrionaceae bacterium]
MMSLYRRFTMRILFPVVCLNLSLVSSVFSSDDSSLELDVCKKFLIQPTFYLKDRSDNWFVEPKQTHSLFNALKSKFLEKDIFFRYTFKTRSKRYDEVLRFGIFLNKPAKDLELAYNMLSVSTIGLLPMVDRKEMVYRLEHVIDGETQAVLTLDSARTDVGGLFAEGGLNPEPLAGHSKSIDDFVDVILKKIVVRECD